MNEINTATPDVEHAIGYIAPRLMVAVDRHPEDRELRQALEMLNNIRLGVTVPTDDEGGPVDPDDYWVRLAGSLCEVANRIATLAGNNAGDRHPSLSFDLSYSPNNEMVPLVDTIAALFGSTAAPENPATNWYYSATSRLGDLKVSVSTRIPTPSDPRDARIAELEAELARRDAATVEAPRGTEAGDPAASVPADVEGHRLVHAPGSPRAALDPETPLDDLPADFDAGFISVTGCCTDCDDELELAAAGGAR